MTKILKNHPFWVFTLSITFILINGLLLYHEFYLFLFIPFALILLYLAFFHIHKFLLAITFLTPLSIPLDSVFNELPFNFYIPTEPFLLILLLITGLKLLHEKVFLPPLLKHPVSIIIYIQLIWLLITSFTSSMPIISLKFLLSRLWYVIPFFFILSHFVGDKKYANQFLNVYILSLTVVIFYALLKQYSLGMFDRNHAQVAPTPFFNDHTAFGAVLAMFLPAVFIKFRKNTKKSRHLIWLILFSTALIFTYSRAAWVSILFAGVIYIIITLKIKFPHLAFLTGSFLLILIIFLNPVREKLEKNEKESSGNMYTHIQSIVNISSDASNTERINRWKCAFRMHKERPWLGWGPGTYMFQYAPFQKSDERTIISTNSADGGNAHSEYLGPLSETGLPGLISVLLLIVYTIITGIRIFRNVQDPEIKYLALSALLGLITYFTHGLLNNFLDMDDAAVPFWGFIALLVAFDLKYNRDEKGRLKKFNPNDGNIVK